MKQVGPNLFVGDDPYLCLQAAQIQQVRRRRGLDSEPTEPVQSPSQRFMSLLKETTTKPRRFGFLTDHSYFRFGDSTLISVTKTEGLTGVPDCKQFMVHLESIYVIDVARGQGCGTSCMKMLTQIAEESGCVIDLYCNPFVWSCDGRCQYAVETFEQLWGVVFDDKWQVLHHKDSQSDLTKFFYLRSGFVNMCLYDKWVYGRDRSEDLPFEQQFAYLPSSLKPEYRQQLENRLKMEGCEFCNRT